MEYPAIRNEVEGSGGSYLRDNDRKSIDFAAGDNPSLQNQPSAQNPFRAHDLAKFLQILFHRFADDGVAVIAPVCHLARGGFQTRLDLLSRLATAFGQTTPQFFQVRRHDENVSQGILHKTIAAIANSGGALRVDVDQNIDPIF